MLLKMNLGNQSFDCISIVKIFNRVEILDIDKFFYQICWLLSENHSLFIEEKKFIRVFL